MNRVAREGDCWAWVDLLALSAAKGTIDLDLIWSEVAPIAIVAFGIQAF